MVQDIERHRSPEACHRAPAPERQITALSSLLEGLDEVGSPHVSPQAQREAHHQQRLAQVRLGMASSLFVAVRARHPRTAAHSLRVALTCSSWAILLELGERVRDELEVAALLHDVGKIGVPDRVLLKPGKLSAEEAALMNRQRDYARQILACCAPQEVVDIVYFASAWYDGRNRQFQRSGRDLPLGSRILSIVDAFDAMTTDHVYRRAMPRERAMAELFEYAGTQFDPELVQGFHGFLSANQNPLTAAVSRHWLRDLHQSQANDRWRAAPPPAADAHFDIERVFHERLLESMNHAVIFVDTGLKILRWNRAAELLTGISASSAEHQYWDPSVLRLRDASRKRILAETCPVVRAVKGGCCSQDRLFVVNQRDEETVVNAYATPIVASDGSVCGAILLLEDTSSQLTLEQRVQRLNEKIKQDPLTGVANRAGFDRAHHDLVRSHLERGTPYSLIICDLDHFKKINDTYGHQAGDEALIAFAATLKQSCPTGGLVARYGGEEFVLLCPECENSQTAQVAETIRRTLAAQPIASLGGAHLAASFGVTELQRGDTPDTMLRRADRALLQAKNQGRDAVVQIGVGMGGQPDSDRHAPVRDDRLQEDSDGPALQCTLSTPVPLNLAIEKLRGFVFDQGAEVEHIDEEHVTLRIDGSAGFSWRRSNDRPSSFLVAIRFEEMRLDQQGRKGATDLRTLAHVTIRPKRRRDRRRRDAAERARELLFSLKSYLMAHEFQASEQ